LDTWSEGKTWLEGEECSYADIAFLSWIDHPAVGNNVVIVKEYLNVHAWVERIKARPALAKVYEESAEK